MWSLVVGRHGVVIARPRGDGDDAIAPAGLTFGAVRGVALTSDPSAGGVRGGKGRAGLRGRGEGDDASAPAGLTSGAARGVARTEPCPSITARVVHGLDDVLGVPVGFFHVRSGGSAKAGLHAIVETVGEIFNGRNEQFVDVGGIDWRGRYYFISVGRRLRRIVG